MADSHSTDAGSSRKPRRDLTGQRFGRLVVLELSAQKNGTNSCWICLCDCGAKTVVRGTYLRNGITRSCGCLARALSSQRGKIGAIGKRARTHGMSHIPEYKVWAEMIQRCRNPHDTKYAHYGGRGIAVCERWLSFENFIADMGQRPSAKHSIDRIDNDGDYCPENCQWATQKQQTRNSRKNRLLTLNGESLPAVVWAEKLGIPSQVIFHRMSRGWSDERALTQPIRRQT